MQGFADAMARWEDLTRLPLETRQRFHQSQKQGEAHGGWSLMREHAVYHSRMSLADLESTEPKQEYGFSVETNKTL